MRKLRQDWHRRSVSRKMLSGLLLTLSLSTSAYATDANCLPLVVKCDKAIETLTVRAETAESVEAHALSQLGEYRAVADAKEAQLQAWYRNPWTTTMLGVIVGAVVTGYVYGRR